MADEGEARGGPAAAAGLWPRWAGLWPRWAGRAAGRASPFGLAVRPARANSGPPFPASEYRPPYLPPGLAIHVAGGVPADEPWWFHLPFARRPDDPGRAGDLRPDHPAGVREVTGVRLSGPWAARPSAAAAAVGRAAGVEFVAAPAHLAEVTLDGGGRGAVADARPALPAGRRRTTPLLPLIFRRLRLPAGLPRGEHDLVAKCDQMIRSLTRRVDGRADNSDYSLIAR